MNEYQIDIGFIKLTEYIEEIELFIKPSSIAMFHDVANHAIITLTTGEKIHVEQRSDEIWNSFKDLAVRIATNQTESV